MRRAGVVGAALWVAASLVRCGFASAGPEQAMLTRDEINAIVAESDPAAEAFWNSDPVAHQPRTPPDDLASPCGRVLPLYFGGDEPRFSSYATQWITGSHNMFASQLVAQYATAAQATARFGALAGEVSACADALARQADATMVVTPGGMTPDSARFQNQPAGANHNVSNGHVVSNEYRLVGRSIVAAWSTESPSVVSAVAAQLGDRVRDS